MSCRSLVVALVLLVAPAALAQGETATQTEPKWTVDFETVFGQRSLYYPVWFDPAGDRCLPFECQSGSVMRNLLAATVTGFSSLATVRYRPTEQLSVGAVVPFVIGYLRWEPAPSGALPGEAFGHLGALALFGTWEHRAGRTRIPVGVLIAFPTAVGGPGVPPDASQQFAEGTRGFEDRELFYRGFALVPSAAVLHDFGRVELSTSAKVPLRLNYFPGEPPCNGECMTPRAAIPVFVVDVLGAAQVMVKVVNRPRAVLSGGVRAVAMVSTWPTSGPPYGWGFSVALEPRIEALLDALALRVGLIIPLAVDASRCETQACSDGWNTGRFPEAWGVRLGVGYSF